MSKKPGLGTFIALLLWLPLSVVIRGLTAKKLYDWFAVPAGAPHVSWVNLFGCTLIVTALTAKRQDMKSASNGDENSWVVVFSDVLFWTVFCGFLLGEGWILSLFVTG